MEENTVNETAVVQENATDQWNDCPEPDLLSEEDAREREEDEEATLLSEKEEYERLIKHRFKELYAADMQRLINRRFRKYKVLEERYKVMEETLREKEAALAGSCKQLESFEERLAEACRRTAEETEERLLGRLRARQLRPPENGLHRGSGFGRSDVSGLTKSERARLAMRAADGERIKL